MQRPVVKLQLGRVFQPARIFLKCVARPADKLAKLIAAGQTNEIADDLMNQGEKHMQSLRLLWGGILTMLLCATLALAQTGSIQGTMTDSAGAVVQGAEITVRNLGSNAVRTVTSSGTGAYSIPSLPPAAYDITVKMASFKTFHATDVQLTVAQVLSVNVQLEPGAVSEEVQVRADQIPDVDLESSQVSNLVDERAIKDLPLITRNPYELVLLSPGTSQTNALGGITVNGARERNNNFLLDGVDNNDTGVPGGIVSALNADPDSTQEFRVITNNFAAEYGRNTGAIIDVVTKSGTNTFHGTAVRIWPLECIRRRAGLV